MKKLIYPTSLNLIEKSIDLIDGFIVGINSLSVNIPLVIEKEEITKFNYDKEIFISLNKNIFNSDIEDLKDTLLYLKDKKISGILFYDLSVLKLVNELNINIPLVWSQEHLTTNYLTCNYYYEKGCTYVNLSSEITLKEIIDITSKTKLLTIVPIFGYLPMFNSKRHIVNNYLDTFNLDKNSNVHYMYKENNYYPILDDKNGTTAYSSKILNGLDEINILSKNKVAYVTYNSFNIDDNKFLKVLEGENPDNLFNNTDKGFLYKETIYRVKKNDKEN